MKKILFASVIGMAFTCVFTNAAQAQIFKTDLSSLNTRALFTLVSTEEENAVEAEKTGDESKSGLEEAKANLKMQKANFRAAEYLRKEFKNAPDVKWTVQKEVIMASFRKDDIHTDVMYNTKGYWLHTISRYDESKIPADMKADISNAYRGYTITQVQEIKEGTVTFYVVHLEDSKSYKLISVYNGEMNVYEEFDKTL